MRTKFRFPSHYSRQFGPSGIRSARRLYWRRHIRNQAVEAIRLRGALVFEHRLNLVAQLRRTLMPVG
jgi:hypothetical protein